MKKKTKPKAAQQPEPAKKVAKPKPKTIALAMVLIGKDEEGRPVHDARYQVLKSEMRREDFVALRQELAELALRAREDLEELDRRPRLLPDSV